MSTVFQSLQLGLQHHQAGHLDLAARVYRQVLQSEPQNADAHHLLGLVSLAQGQPTPAIEYFLSAISCNPLPSEFHHHLGAAYWAARQKQQAIDCFRKALSIEPNTAETHNDLGNALREVRQLAEAEQCFREAVRLDPQMAEPHNNLGTMLQEQGRLADALECFQRAFGLLPRSPEISFNLGNCYQALDRAPEAEAAYQRALEIKPDFVVARYALGNLWYAENRRDEAIACYRECLRQQPEFAEAHNALGLALQSSHLVAEAKACYQRALTIEPANGPARYNLATALLAEGDYAGAEQQVDHALEVWPQGAEAHFFRGTLLIAKGQLPAGWHEFEYRAKCKLGTDRGFTQPRWDGAPLGKSTLLLYSDSGLGDAMQFVRYAPLVQARHPDARVLIEVPASLVALLVQSGFDNVVAKDTAFDFNLHLPLTSLPAVFETTLDDIPADVPYLFASPARTEHWQQRLAEIEGFKVGIQWQGSAAYAKDSRRSMALSCFAPLAQVPGVQLISLQHGAGVEQLGSAPFSIISFEQVDAEGDAFLDTAAIVKGLDLVITCDSAVGHLVGALASPVWLALAYVPECRWMRDRDDTPWYPLTRLFRQARIDDWSELFQRIAGELACNVARHPLRSDLRS